MVNRDGVYRYHNRNPPDDLTTRDHRLELIKKGDARDTLRSAVSELPDAPLYIVLSLDADDMDKWYARLEAGFVAGNMLLQGSAIGVGGWFTTGLGDDKQENYLKNKPQISGVLLTHLVNHSFTALGLRPQTPERRRRWRCLT